MTAPIAPTPAANAGSPLANATVGGPMGKNEFIKLLVAQMTHQDPMNPTDGQAMAAQLAQFSSVEQLINIGDKLDAQSAGNAALIGVVNNSSAMNLLGRDVTVQSDTITVGPNPTTDVSVNVPEGGGTSTIRVTDANGVTLRTVPLGFLGAGSHTIGLTNATKGLPTGEYHVVIDCQQPGGTAHLVPHLAVHVDGVRFGTDGAMITSGSHTYPIGLIDSITTAS